MTNSVAKFVERLRNVGYDINPVNNSHIWQVPERGHMTTGQLIDFSTKVAIRT
jgi:biotin operon repressor